MTTKLEQLVQLHANLLQSNPYCYFELAYTRHTEWTAWICSNQRETNPNRKVLARGQGETIEEAADRALQSFRANL